MNINEDAERILQIGMKIKENDSFSQYEKAIEEIIKTLEQWYKTGKNTCFYEIEQSLNQEYKRGYIQGEKETHENYKLGIYS